MHEKFLNEIIEKLNKAISLIDENVREGEKDIEGMQEYYWMNYTEMDEYGYENYDNQRLLFLQENSNQEQRILRARYCKMLKSPYFGRVDFVFDGENDPEHFYIGIGNFSEDAGAMPLIYDWRAPVSSLFYDYDAGKASYDAPIGRIDGEITGKGQYKIRNGKIIYAFDSDVKIDDEVLSLELSTKGETKLKNIIQTIQKEQNLIIRNTEDKILVIQGVAGSGKTSVALHRIAYLLYHSREQLKSKNVLIISPNGIFSDYISHILPELGEENILEMSFDTFAYHELKSIVKDTKDRSDLMENLLMGIENPSSYKEKSSKDFVYMLDEYAIELEDELVETRDVRIKKWTKTAREIEELFYFKFTDFPLLERMDEVMEYVLDEYITLTGISLSPEEEEDIKNQFDAMYQTKDIYVLYSRFLERYGYEGLSHKQYENRILEYADVYPLLYLKYKLKKGKEHKQIKHLVIDEMQDYNYIQYRILSQLFNCSMTILGDKEQTLDDDPRDVRNILREVLGRNIKCLEMNKSYRNTVEIAEYAKSIQEYADANIFDRHGEKVHTYECEGITEASVYIAEDVKKLITQKDYEIFETAAVITYTEKEAEELYSNLKHLLSDSGYDVENRLTLIDRDSKRFRVGITVIPYYLAKGLEFEAVYFIDNKKLQDALHRQGRYIAATRALHKLMVIDVS